MSSRVWTEVCILFILGRRQQLLKQGIKIWYGLATSKTQWFPKLFLVPVQACPWCSDMKCPWYCFKLSCPSREGLVDSGKLLSPRSFHLKNQPLNTWFSYLLQRISRDGSCRGSEIFVCCLFCVAGKWWSWWMWMSCKLLLRLVGLLAIPSHTMRVSSCK